MNDNTPGDLFLQIDVLMKEQQLFTDRDLDVRTVAQKAGINDRALSECVRKGAGAGFMEYVNIMRLSFARELLLTKSDKMTIEAIAKEAGFKSRNTFYTLFRENYGLTPKEFLKSSK